MPKRIPYAVANFEKLVGEDFYFVDKTRFLRELEKFQAPVFLRPRRFGKSLWCSVLECYYDVNRRDRFEALFGQFDIGRAPTPERNRYLVLRFDFSKIPVESTESGIRQRFDEECLNSFEIFLNDYRAFFGGFERPASADAAALLARILQTARKAGAPPVYLIIDEYDNFTNQLVTAHQDGLYAELTTGDSFLRTFFKVIKAGVGDGSVGRVFITGVLPITIDDLTSGFNIAQIITLEPETLSMMGFTQAETDAYVDAVFRDYELPGGLLPQVRETIRTLYNGYRLLPDADETLYNSTILNFFLDKLVRGMGRLPTETIDDNLRVDVNWLRRLAGSEEGTRQLLEQLMFEGTLPVDMTMLRAKFNLRQFFERRFYPLSLYYLGMLTFRDRFSVEFPNLTVKTIFTEYFNEVERISVSEGYTDMFRRFLTDGDLPALFAGYWARYVGQIPAQAFDKVNENFYRTTFYELCTRYLSPDFVFAIEVNHPCGRSDWEAIGRPEGAFPTTTFVIEFKHLAGEDGKRLGVTDWPTPREDDAAQVAAYAAELKRKYPTHTVRPYVFYTLSHTGFRCFALDPA